MDAPSFGMIYKGYIKIPETGIYSFFLTCDDGGVLWINDKMVVDNDGLHSSLEKGGQAALQKGYHPFLLKFIEGGGGFQLKLLYAKDGGKAQHVPADWLCH